MFDVQIMLFCDTCEQEYDHQFEATELVGSEASWSARAIVDAAGEDGWSIERQDATCPDCQERHSVEDQDDGDHKRDELALYGSLRDEDRR